MAGPLALPVWVYYAAIAAGTMAQARSQNMKADAAAQAQMRYADRTDRNAEKAEGLFQDNMADYQTDPRSQANEAANERAERSGELAEAERMDPLRGGLDNAEAGTRKSIAKLIGQELAKGEGQVKAKAMLDGYSDRSFEQALRNRGRQAELGILSAYDQSNRNMLNADMTAAQGKGQGMGVLGDSLVTLGMLGTTFGGAPAQGPQVVGGTTASPNLPTGGRGWPGVNFFNPVGK